MVMKSVTPDTNRGEAISELQGLTTIVVAGAAALTNIAVAGLGIKDTLQSVVQYTGGVPSVVLDASITAAGVIQTAVTITTGNTLVVQFYKKP